MSNFKNKIVVLEWFDDRCPFDRKHYDSGNMQSLPYFLLDPDGKVGHLYKAKTTPDMHIIGKN